jgi:ankyrin repeat protein
MIKDGYFTSNELIHPLKSETPLSLALNFSRYDLAKTLLALGANINGLATDGDQKTALWKAANSGHTKQL